MTDYKNNKLTAKIVKGDLEVYGNVIPGGMDAMSWKDYLKCFPAELRPTIRAIRNSVKKSEFKNTKADVFCNDYYFELSDGQTIAFTWRAWGDLLSSMNNKMEGYMAYYM